MSKFVFYKQCIKVQSSLNLKSIKFNQILLENISGKRGKRMHYFDLKTAQPAQNIWRWPNCNWARMHAARARCCAGRRPVSAPPRALATRGRGNLGPGRHFATPPGPKEAQFRATQSLPSNADQRPRARCGRTKPPRGSPR
jgi:hypothetical protein